MIPTATRVENARKKLNILWHELMGWLAWVRYTYSFSALGETKYTVGTSLLLFIDASCEYDQLNGCNATSQAA